LNGKGQVVTRMTRRSLRQTHRRAYPGNWLKILIWTSVALVTGLVLTTSEGTLAYLSGQSSVSNTLKTPIVQTVVDESNDGGFESNWSNPGIVWGGNAAKFVRFTNEGESSVVIRASYAQSWTAEDGSILSNTYYAGATAQPPYYRPVAVPHWTNEGFGNTAYWYSTGDGWYYYRYPLAPGASTEAILDYVSFALLSDPDYANANYALNFQVESCQYSTNPQNENQQAVWETFRMTYAETAGVLTWSTPAP
jgi:hypothetical protein